MKPFVNLRMVGRWGNQLFQYAFARAYCERSGFELRTEPWIGQVIFAIDDPPIQEPCSVVRSDVCFKDGEPNIELRGYFQSKRSLIYTRSQVRQWLTMRPAIVSALDGLPVAELLAHMRHGDYFGYGYPVVSRNSYIAACEKFGYDSSKLEFATEESPTFHPLCVGSLSFFPDFYRLMTANVLFRGNSTFSWWAATLAHPGQKVYSPVIDGLPGGKEHDVQFVEGNAPRFANLAFTEDLELKP